MKHPEWLNVQEYPFASKFLQVPAGRLHYVDEGNGNPIVMIHGTPAWSFLYRKLIKQLSGEKRCIAFDHIGFGLSDKPQDWSYKPEDHADNFERLVEHLGLKNITLVMHDFGAPIGLSYAIKHPENVKNLVLLNTWMWSLTSLREPGKASKYMIGPLGKFLYKHYNDSAEGVMEEAFGGGKKLSPELKEQYIRALGNPKDRISSWACARDLVGVTQWYKELWKQRKKIQDIPALILWGVQDQFIAPEILQRWKKFFHECYVIKFEEAGHFVMEENAEEICAYIENFLVEEKQKAA